MSSRAPLVALLVVAALLAGGCSRQEAAWREARGRDDVAAYRVYLQDFPAGTHAAEARERLRFLVEQEHWLRALRLDTPEALQRFLAEHPEGRHAPEARARLEEFVAAGQAPPAPVAVAKPGTWLQVGAFSRGAAAAEAAWAPLLDRHPGLFDGLEPVVEAVERDGEPLWRLLAGPVTVPRAAEVCAVLEALGDTCLVVTR